MQQQSFSGNLKEIEEDCEGGPTLRCCCKTIAFSIVFWQELIWYYSILHEQTNDYVLMFSRLSITPEATHVEPWTRPEYFLEKVYLDMLVGLLHGLSRGQHLPKWIVSQGALLVNRLCRVPPHVQAPVEKNLISASLCSCPKLLISWDISVNN